MKICIAQIRPIKGNILQNIAIHKTWIELAVAEDADLIAFPELSLTGYEPELAEGLAMGITDPRLDEFQRTSDLNDIAIGLGIPTKSKPGVFISMVIFQPNQGRKAYSKQMLHSDELPYFAEGDGQLILTVGNKKIAPAICYESLQNEHSGNAKKLGAEIYLASVAKPQNGIEKAYLHYPKIAKEFSMPVLMSNSIGFCDNFLSVGQSAVWNKKGEVLGKMENEQEGLLIFDTETEKVVNVGVKSRGWDLKSPTARSRD